MKFQTVRGMQDFLPEKAEKKKRIEEICRKVFESYGFRPLESPIVEDFGLLAAKGSAGEAIKEEIYYFKDKSERELGLRFDLTVPLARIAASNPQLPMPFKRYQIGRVYRYDRPQKNRYREFTQSDWDILGGNSTLADFEAIAVAIRIMQKLDFKQGEFKIRVSSRTLLEEIAKSSGYKSTTVTECFGVLDKLDKIGLEGVREDLKKRKLPTKVLDFISTKKDFNAIKKAGIKKAATEDLEELFNLLKQNSLEKFVELDLSLTRGLEYYTGLVFEISVTGFPSVGGGGRYDKLVEKYGGLKTQAVGGSFGIDRLLDVIGPKMTLKTKTEFFIAPVYKTEKWDYKKEKSAETTKIPDKLKEIKLYMTLIATKIRTKDRNCEIDLMMRNIAKNLQNVTRRGIPFVIIVGEDELNNKELTIKDMKRKKQKRIKFSDLEKEIDSIPK